MPGLSQFLSGFGIYKGLQLADYILQNIQGDEQQIVRYREYEYPIQIVFTPQYGQVSSQTLLSQFNQMVSGKRIIYSSYGNPYECNFGNPQITQISANGTVVIETIGHSYRV